MIANEKRRRRRESHNAVERRRRDNINEKISELATLIPECLIDPNGQYCDELPCRRIYARTLSYADILSAYSHHGRVCHACFCV